MTEDQLILFIAGLPGVVAVKASEAGGAPEVAWGDSFFFYDPEGDVPAERRLPFATIVTKDYDGFDMASNLNRHGIYRLNLAVGRVRFGQLVGYPAGPTCSARGGFRLQRAGLRAPPPRVRHPSMGVDSESGRQDQRTGALPDRRGPQAGSGTSPAAPLSASRPASPQPALGEGSEAAR